LIRAVVDTHALIWYLFGDSRVSATARGEIDGAAASGEQIAISTISLVEIISLIEKRRIDATTFDQVLGQLNSGILFVEIVVDRPVILAMRALDRMQVPELPDRVIAATAVRLGVPLISRDHKIQTSRATTIW
jgi:PIN domain nuclease of toxin-antitoxin system